MPEIRECHEATRSQNIKYLRPDYDLMRELRQMIFNSRQDDCLSQAELEEIYAAGTHSQPAITSPDNLLLNLEDVWQIDLSARSFAALIEQPTLAKVEERPAAYVLSYGVGRTIGASRLLRATLTLNKSDFHAIEQTVVVERDGVLHEYDSSKRALSYSI